MFGESITFLDGLLITALGMGVTFAALIALSFMLDLLRIVFYKDPNKKAVQIKEKEISAEKQEPKEVEVSKEEGEELIAVITAAVAASLNSTTHNIIVKQIKRIPDTTPAWAKAGRIDQMSQRL